MVFDGVPHRRTRGLSIGVSTVPSFSWTLVSGDAGYRIMVATSASVLPTDPSSSTCSGCTINDTTATGAEPDLPRHHHRHRLPDQHTTTPTMQWSGFGRSLQQICRAVQQISERPDVEVHWPLHPNPHVQRTVRTTLGQSTNIHLTETLDYVSFVEVMRQSYLLLTDSGGVQEEGASLGRPVLVMRHQTDRPEAVGAGISKLVGTETNSIVDAVTQLLDDSGEHQRMSRAGNIYGDGHAGMRIAKRVAEALNIGTS